MLCVVCCVLCVVCCVLCVVCCLLFVVCCVLCVVCCVLCVVCCVLVSQCPSDVPVCVRNVSVQTVLRAATLTYNLPDKLLSPSQIILTLGQPVLTLTTQGDAPVGVSTSATMLKWAVRFHQRERERERAGLHPLPPALEEHVLVTWLSGWCSGETRLGHLAVRVVFW